MAESLKKKTAKGVAWTSLDQVLTLGTGFVISIILARLLSPADYGLLAMILVFNALAFVFLDSGFGNALIRKPDLVEDDNTTAFIFNVVAGFVIYGVLYAVAPLVAAFYEMDILCPLLRAEGIIVIFFSFRVVQNAHLARELKFGAKAFINVSSCVMGGAAGIFAAYHGMGVWALVVQHTSTAFLAMVVTWIVSSWKPRGHWSKTSFSYLWGYGSKMMASGVLDTFYRNIYPIIIGKFYSPAQLGQYSHGKQYAQLPSTALTNMLQQVTFPVLSKIQNDDARLADGYRRMLRFISFIVFPVMVTLSALAQPFVVTLVTDKWLPCVPYLQVICFASMWYPVHAINLNLLQVKGRSDLFLYLEIAKKAIITIAILITVKLGIMAICIGSLCTSLISLVINTHFTGKLIHVGFLLQMRDLLPALSLSLFTGAVAHFAVMPIPDVRLQLFVGVLVAAVVYLAGAWLFRFPELNEARGIIFRSKK